MDIQSLWLRHHGALVQYLLRYTRSRMEAEDIAQTTFVRAMERVDEIAPLSDAHIKGWLYKTAYNAFIDNVRRQKRQAPLEESHIPTYEEDFSNLHVAQLLDSLPPGLREIVRLRHLQGYNSQQIGQMLHLTPATVRTRLRAAMMLLQKYENKQKQ